MTQRMTLILLTWLLLPSLVMSETRTNTQSGLCQNLTTAFRNNYAKTHWTERPTGQQVGIYTGVGMADKINLFGQTDFYGVANLMLVWERTWHSERNSSFFAARDGTIVVANGSGAKMVNAEGILTDGALTTYQIEYGELTTLTPDIRSSDLGLASTTYFSSNCLKPRITNAVAHIDFYAGLDNLIQGLYARIRAPLTWTRWDLGFTISEERSQQELFVQGFINPLGPISDNAAFTLNPPDRSLIDAADAFDGTEHVGGIPQLEYGRVCAQQSVFGVSDLPIDLGLNFYLTERMRFGASLHIVAPLGTTDDGQCLFSPRVGLGRWQIGAQIGFRWYAWENDDQRVGFFGEFCPCAVLSANQKRLLGLQLNGDYAFNHYLLLKQFNVKLTDPMAGEQPLLNAAVLQRAANLLFQDLELGAMFNGDAALWFQYKRGSAEFIVGWNISGRQAEYVNDPISEIGNEYIPSGVTFGNGSTLYVIKGDTPLFLPLVSAAPPPFSYTGQTISPHTYSKADSDIKTLGTLIPLGSTYPAQNQATGPGMPTLPTSTVEQINATAITALDVTAAPALHGSMLSNALFAYVGVEVDNIDVDAFIGVGAQIELGTHNSAMDFETFFIKGGFRF